MARLTSMPVPSASPLARWGCVVQEPEEVKSDGRGCVGRDEFGVVEEVGNEGGGERVLPWEEETNFPSQLLVLLFLENT